MDLPAPLGPKKPSISPRLITKLIPLIISLFLIVFVIFETLRTFASIVNTIPSLLITITFRVAI